MSKKKKKKKIWILSWKNFSFFNQPPLQWSLIFLTYLLPLLSPPYLHPQIPFPSPPRILDKNFKFLFNPLFFISYPFTALQMSKNPVARKKKKKRANLSIRKIEKWKKKNANFSKYQLNCINFFHCKKKKKKRKIKSAKTFFLWIKFSYLWKRKKWTELSSKILQ